MRRSSASAPMPRRFWRARASPTRRSASSSAPPSPRSLGLATAPLLLRGADLTRLMVTLGVSLMLGELANRNGWLTGGADGLNFAIAPVLGLFPIGFTGQRNAALYSFAVLLHAVRDRAPPRAVALRAFAARRSARTGCAPARSASTPAGASSRSMRLSAAYAGAAGALLGADDADRLARPVRLPSLGRRHADADHRRRRLSLWRPHRRGGRSSC